MSFQNKMNEKISVQPKCQISITKLMMMIKIVFREMFDSWYWLWLWFFFGFLKMNSIWLSTKQATKQNILLLCVYSLCKEFNHMINFLMMMTTTTTIIIIIIKIFSWFIIIIIYRKFSAFFLFQIGNTVMFIIDERFFLFVYRHSYHNN